MNKIDPFFGLVRQRNLANLDGFFDDVDLDKILRPGHKVLELGCGHGHIPDDLAKKYGVKGYGIDLGNFPSSVAIVGDTEFKRIPVRLNHQLVIGRMEYSPFADNSFDFVFSFMAMYLLRGTSKTIQSISEAHRILKVGGVGVLDCGPEYVGGGLNSFLSRNASQIVHDNVEVDPFTASNPCDRLIIRKTGGLN